MIKKTFRHFARIKVFSLYHIQYDASIHDKHYDIHIGFQDITGLLYITVVDYCSRF